MLLAGSWEERIIVALEVQGDQNTPVPEVAWRETIRIHSGDRYHTRLIREAVQRLYETGNITNVKVQVVPRADQTVAVTFLISERKQIAVVSFSGNRQFTKKEVLKALRVTPGELFDPFEWDARLQGLIALYKQEGYFDLLLQSRFTPIPSDRLTIAVHLDIQEGGRARIRHFTFSGFRHLPDPDLYHFVRSRSPKFFSQKRLGEDRERLRAFYKKKGYRMAKVGLPEIHYVAEKREVDIVLPISASTRIDLFFQGFDSLFSPAQRESFIAMSAEQGDTPEVLEESARALERAYRDRGYPFATVKVDAVAFPEKNLKEVYFRATGLTRAKIRKMAFTGNRALDSKQLNAFVRLKKESLLTSTLFTDTQLQEDAENIARFYKQNGYQSVQVSPDIHFDEATEWAEITFRIEEGVQTQIGTVVLEGTHPFSSSALLDMVGLHTGEPFHFGVAREGATRILTALARLGYIDAKVDPEVTVSSDQTMADIRYQIESEKQVYFGTLHLFGNETTRNGTLLREMLIKPGDPYDYEKILKSQQRLYQTGLFSGIRFDPIRQAENPTVQDMNLTVTELPRLVIEAGPGYGDREGMRGFLDVGYRNLFGSGRKISARASGSHREQRYSLNYKEPRVLPYDVDLTLSGIAFYIPQISFDEEAKIGTLGFERQLTREWKGALLYQYEDKEISNVGPGAQLTAQDVGRVIIGGLNPAITRDTRDDPFQPRNGSVFGVTLRDAAQILGSHVQMVKGVQHGSFFFSPVPRVTIALSERLGVAKRFGETAVIPLSERFFLGGQSTVRGYPYQMLGRTGETLIGSQPTGGNAMLVLNEEVRLSLWGSLGMVFFLDHGNVWREEGEIALGELKSTAGAGLRYNTPFGPLRFDWGYKLDREEGEVSSDSHFTLGHAF